MAKLSNWPDDSLDQWTSYPVRLIAPHSGQTSSIGSSPGKTCWDSTLPGYYFQTVQYASALPSHSWPTMRTRCTNFLHLAGRWEKSTWWPESWSGKADLAVRYPRRGISVSELELDHSSGLLQLCETRNSPKFGQLFCAWKLKVKEKLAKYGISSKINSSSWLRKFYLLAQDGWSRPSVWFSRLRNQYVIWIRIWERMVDLGEKMETHVSEISPRSWAKN